MNRAKNTSTAANVWRLLFGLFLGAAILTSPSAPAHAADKADGLLGEDTSRWKRTANFVSDRNSGFDQRRRRRAATKRLRSKRAFGPKTVPAFRADQLLVAFPTESSEQLIDAVADEHDITRLEDITVALLDKRIVKFKLAPARRKRVSKALSKDKRIHAVQPNHLYVLGSTSKTQYALKKLSLDEVHRYADGTDIRIAMLDSGVNHQHPVFGGLQIEEFDATESAASKHDGHGTAVASLIAAQAGMTGIVPNPDLLSAKTFSYSGRWRRTVGETYHLLQGLDWAVFKKARVFNMSFAGPEDALLGSALQETLKTDAVIIAAAGNNGARAAPAYPAAYDGVIAVTATDRRNRLYRYANRGKYILVAAPGVNILSANGRDGYSRKSGTSLAAAHVTGIVALMMQASPDATPEAIAEKIAATARDLGKAGRDTSFGYGMINPVKLVTPPALTN